MIGEKWNRKALPLNLIQTTIEVTIKCPIDNSGWLYHKSIKLQKQIQSNTLKHHKKNPTSREHPIETRLKPAILQLSH